ncbi:MAG: hydrogenase 4 subunit B [Deltaproteobacteria bacterium]|nr:hydrogenase 4 subunit B [Deltaproteobacteria bacterium]
MVIPSPLESVSLSVVIFLVTAAAAPLLKSRQASLINIAFSASAIASVIAAFAGFNAVATGAVETMVLPVGLPDLPFYLRLDATSGFFVTVTAVLVFFVSIYSIGYLKGFIGHPAGLAGQRKVTSLAVFYCLFVAGMLMVVLADDAYFFMISWELMAAASYFLVVFEDENKEARRAAFIYLLIAHVGAILILLSFGVMAGLSGGFENFNGYTFSAMRASHIPGVWKAAAFFLSFFGFAAKAGVVPLHVWLPEAHPVAPTNVSALMSGVMLKVAVYGMVRVSFDLLHVSDWRMGGVVLVMGLVSAVMGILYALMQVDLKRLLAYSSIENVGIILVCLGLAMIFKSFDMTALASLSLVAGLYHITNHAMFKGLLFMGAGAVMHSTHERNMERMGGLIHRMPQTAVFFLVGCLSISALPPFNGFVSEWLLFQAFLLSPSFPTPLLNLIIPLGAALVALTAALSARCFVKVFGVVFLGRWRGQHDTTVNETGLEMRGAMGFAAFACLALGLLPVFFIGWIDAIPRELVGGRVSETASEFGWLWLTPVAAERASYSAPVVFAGILAVVAAAYLLTRIPRAGVRRAPVWDCGFEKITPRMQYNSTSFAMPLRRIFGFLLSVRETVRPSGADPAFPKRLTYRLKIRDRIWHGCYMPVADASFWIARRFGRLQHGRIQIYLLYSFATLILLLVFA